MGINDQLAKTGRVLSEFGNWFNVLDFMSHVLVDQSGRVRTSEPISLGGYKLQSDRLPLFFDTVTSGTTVSYNASHRAHDMQTDGDGEYAVVQTYQRHNYFTGRSQKIEMTSFNFQPETNVVKRSGYFSSSVSAPYTALKDGCWLESGDGVVRLVIYNNGDEILSVPQSEWNDPLDGTGASKFTIDWERFNVFRISFLWLGGTGLSLSILIGSKAHLVYDYSHVGSANSDKLIMSRPNQPIRYEIRQTGAGSGRFRPVCASVVSEGSISSSEVGSVRAVDVGEDDIVNAASNANEYLVKGIRLKSDYVATIIDLIDIDIFVETGNDEFRWRLHLNPTITGGSPSWQDVPDSSVQRASGDGSLLVGTEGYILGSGYGESRLGFVKKIQSARKIGASIDGVVDELWLTIQPVQGSSSLNTFGSITYKEFV